jgi:hypothetical protein
MATRIKIRRDTAANWISANPVLALGEPGFETDTRKIKYGDGSATWLNLSYAYSGTGGTGTDYTLPRATGSVLGGIKIGPGLSIDGNGVVSASTGSGASTGNFVFVNSTATVLGNMNFTTTGTIRLVGEFVTFGNTGTAITINPNNGYIIMPNAGEIVGFSGDKFKLRSVDTIYFSDNTQLSSGTFPIPTTSTLVSGAYTVSLSSTGTVSVPGNIVLPQGTVRVQYANVVSTSVNSNTVVIAGGAYPQPQPGWTYNLFTIQSVAPLSGSWQLTLTAPADFLAGSYTLVANPNAIPKSITFSDGTVQTTAYTGQNTGTQFTTATIDLSAVNQHIKPAANVTYDLGSSSTQWQSLWVGPNGVHIGNKTIGVSSTNELTVNGTLIKGSDAVWSAPDSTTWEIKTVTGSYSGTYTQNVHNNTFLCTPAFAQSSTSTIFVNRNTYPTIDNIFPSQTSIRLNGGSPLIVQSIIYDVYADGIMINVQDPVAITTATNINVVYTTFGTGPIKWFDFAQLPHSGVGLIGGEIKYQAITVLNDGAGAKGGETVTLTFNKPANTHDQVQQVFGNTPGSIFTTYNTATNGGFSYSSTVELGQLDRIKVQWVATLYYNGTWA